MSDDLAALVDSEVPSVNSELANPTSSGSGSLQMAAHGPQSTMNSFAPVVVEERWGSAPSATW